MIDTLKQKYIETLIKMFFVETRGVQEPTQIGRILLPLLPHPQVRWKSGFEVVPHYGNRRWLKKSFKGEHEPALEKFILRVVQPSSIVVDVGAQVGMITVLLGKRVGPEGKVISFEPNPYNYRILNEVIQKNRLHNVTTVQKAIGRQNEVLTFKRTVQAGYRMIPRHSAAEGAGKSDVQQVEVTRLDDFCRAEGITKVDFIKIDIDGPDFEALQGAEGILKSPNKPLLSIEMSHYWEEFGHNFSQAFAYLKDLGYVVYIAQRKSSEFFRLDNPEGLPEGLGTLPRQTFNFFGLHLETHQNLIDLMTRLSQE